MAPSITASVTYKKQDGLLTITKDRQLLLFTPSSPPSSPPILKVSTAEITNLGKSPATSERVSVKITAQAPSAPSPNSYVFVFSSLESARTEQETVVDALKEIIAMALGNNHMSTPNPQAAASPAPPNATNVTQVAVAAVTAAKPAKDAFSDSALLSDGPLQKSVLNQTPELKQRFNESLRKLKSMPNAMSSIQFSQQFWSSRIHLLRAQAVENAQVQGTYNVLSEVKTKRNNEGVMKLNLSKEQIQLIFNQHSLVRKVYDDLVPNRLTEADFWSKFFVSKLLKKLKGERITDLDGNIPELDKYLSYDEDADRGRQFEAAQMPRFLDLEANQQDHTQAKGNAPHLMMRPNIKERVPILRVLNAMSEKMMANVAPIDSANLHAPAGMDEKAFEQLQLRDLQAQERDNRILLNISSEQKLFAQAASTNGAGLKEDPNLILRILSQELSSDLQTAMEFDETAKRQAANTSSTIMKNIKQRKSLLSSPSKSDTGLSAYILDSATMTHNTTIEFLHYFWTVYMSGDEARAGELVKLVETLDKSLERINAVATEAETERTQKRAALLQKNQEFQQRTGRQSRISLDSIGGGAAALHKVLMATEHAVKFAEAEYQRTFHEQSAHVNAAGG